MDKPVHYATDIDPIQYLTANTNELEVIGFLRGNAIKYLTRFDKKGGLQDLDKAMDYVQKLRSFYGGIN
jgi:hypothetical protein